MGSRASRTAFASRAPALDAARHRALLLLLLCLLACASGLAAQSGQEVVVKPRGAQYGFRDGDRFVWVFFDGVEVLQGARRMQGDLLVLLLAAGGSEAPSGAAGQALTVSGSRVLEMYLEGNVSIEEGDERVAGAEALHANNVTGVVSMVEGEWRAAYHDVPLVIRFEALRAFDDGRRELEGVRYTTCDYAHHHWHVRTPWARITPTEAGRILSTSGNTVRVGAVPVFWWPGVRLNLDRGDLPIRRLRVGSSSRFGTEIITVWGWDASPTASRVAGWFGHEGDVSAEWILEVDRYSGRGYFLAPTLQYETASSYGEIGGSFIDDRDESDHFDQPIQDQTRGRVDIEHRTRLDEHRVLDVELSYIGDRNYLKEYHENEFREGKQQESYVWYRDVRDNEALTALVRTRLTEFDTQVEYLPEVERRTLAQPLDGFGGALHTSRDLISHAKLVPDDDTKTASLRNLRVGHRSQVDWALDAGGDRLRVTATADVTRFSRTADRGGEARGALLGSARWSQTWVGAKEATSAAWNIDGLRHIVEPSLGYSNVLGLSMDASDLLPLDELETLTERQAFTLGLRHRVQTHQGGKVVTLLDTDLVLPFFPNENRDNAREEAGEILLDSRWTPGADIPGLRGATVHWRATLDPNERTYRQSFLSYSASLGPQRHWFLSHNKGLHAFNFLSVGLQWELTPRWTAALFWREDLRLNENAHAGFVLRQAAHRWFIDISVEKVRGRSVSTGADKDEARVSIRFSPAFLRRDDPLIEKIR